MDIWSNDHELLEKGYNLVWDVVVFLPMALMIGLYSSVVHTLWFKRNDDDQLTYQQQASIGIRRVYSTSRIHQYLNQAIKPARSLSVD